jgi:salicylate hydroxylase
MTLISPEVTQAFENVKSVSPFPEKDHVWYDVRHGTGLKSGELIAEMATAKGFRHCGASRAQFLDELVKLVPEGVKILFRKKVTSVVEMGKKRGLIHISFEDGTSAHADAVVGCDGIRSACRRILLGEDPNANAVYSGKYAYRKVVSMKKAVDAAGPEMETRQIYVGQGGHLLMFPIDNGKLLNVVAFKDDEEGSWTQKQWVIPSSREDLLKDFRGWGEQPTKILELIANPEKWALFDHLPAPTYAKGNFCILGDAAHATTPHSGAGAGFAIEDVHLLSGLLVPELIHSVSDIKHAFRAYDEIRRPRSQALVTRSRTQGMFMDLQMEGGGEVSDERLKNSLASNMKWVWEVDLEDMLRAARVAFKKYKELHL